MTTSEIDSDIKRRVTVAEWVTAVYSIFWSVWWGFFIDGIVNAPGISFQLYSEENGINSVGISLGALTVVVSLFAVFYVRWLWKMHKTTPVVLTIEKFFLDSLYYGFITVILLAAIIFWGIVLTISPLLIFYGVLLTLVWPFVVLFTLWIK